jgi:D-beta-D-heptose 7-phosphate kinase/D-beta-D-heptose 1-phosphate adenosyltransferase
VGDSTKRAGDSQLTGGEAALQVPDFKCASLLVVGDVMLDSYWHGKTSRISPEAPVPVVSVGREEARLGGAGNVAYNAAVLGARTCMLGLAGQDDSGDRLDALLKERGITADLIRVPGARTITKLRVMSQNQQLIRLDFEDAFVGWDGSGLMTGFLERLQQVRAVIFSDYAKGMLRQVGLLIAAARAAGKPIIVDPKGTDFGRYRGATVITPNYSEFEAVMGKCRDEAEIEARAIELREALDLSAVLITRSEKGMSLFARGEAPLHLPTRAQEVYDVTGAGDTVVATLGAAMAAGLPLARAAALSNVAAGIVVGKLGTATVTVPELELALRAGNRATRRGICCEHQLLARVTQAREQGERIVMTNGCFDLLHPGHIDYLEKARALGDRLIVAVNDDESVRRLKGSQRPLNPLATRMRMLAALSCVDWVVSFAEDTPERLYSRVLPDVLVKGGDYRPEDIAGARQVVAAGGEVRVLDFIEGHSTTKLIERIRDSR